MSVPRIAIAGAGGRMGQTLIEAVVGTSDLTLGATFDIATSGVVGRDAGERFGRATGVSVGADSATAIGASDVLIDFTRPAGTMAHVAICAKAGVAAVIGTTGLSEPDCRALGEFARTIPIVFAPNMSVSVTVLNKLVEIAAQSLGNDYDIKSSRCIIATRWTHPRHRPEAWRTTRRGASPRSCRRRLYAAWRCRRTQGGNDRIRDATWRRCRWRSHRDLRRRRRARRTDPPCSLTQEFRTGRIARRTLRGRPAHATPDRPVRHAGRARTELIRR